MYDHFPISDRARELRSKLIAFMEENIFPNEKVFAEQHAAGDRWTHPPIMEELKVKAREAGLWNMFLPHSKEGYEGMGLSNVEYGMLCEQMGKSFIGSEPFNCSAPDTGNMETLFLYGDADQRAKWLRPLMDGEIRSCFSMTEPDVASSDATNIQTEIRRDGDDYVINGVKWWSSGAMDKACKIAIVMGKTDKTAEKHRQQSMILVPLDTPGVTIVRPLHVIGYDHAPHGHAEIRYDNVRVPASNILLGEGRGFEIAQGRLGPGRIHHCMRSIGQAERALQSMCERGLQRTAFGQPIAEMGVNKHWIAESRCEIEQARLLTMHAAYMMDTVGNKAARKEIAMIKVVGANMVQRVVDRAIQFHGAQGVSQDTFLAAAFANARTMRLVDGPDEVHRETIAKLELKQYRN
ncbi:acyl-CoA dehydrogenase family protein [Pseudooceanicola spongiae]|jgi:acyl-CoA dehydrogenase|uniref:Acyl-CoA dehydrogenase n=1 Tax=Pseudooceanicola spongiae TaxID=2613965 RepID=A0A7L9WPI4_9RHOB|nr:acyl-CoA dehydrogenase family protein [Pseudooceanicola spongiae]QOL81744.1 acyl-CoA dehydrogenase [Pseudooceanicola spongiae]